MAERRNALPPDIRSANDMTMASNDASTSPSTILLEPDAHGQAALLLAESILHTLIEKSIISEVEAVSTVYSACDVKVEVVLLTGESSGRMHESLDLLSRIAKTFATDVDWLHPADGHDR